VNILVISNLYPPHVLGGYEILCEQVVNGLVGMGHRVDVLTSGHGFSSRREETCEGRVHRGLRLFVPFERPVLRTQRFARWRIHRHNYRVTTHLIERLEPDLVYVWSQLRLTLGASRASHDAGIPVVYNLNDAHLTSFLPARPGPTPRALAGSLIDRLILPGLTVRGRDLAHATCISRKLKENLIDAGIPVEGARVILQGIPVDRFPVKSDPGSLSDPVRLLYVGQLHAYKGVHTLVEAAGILAGREGCPGPVVTIVGEGALDYTESLKEQASTNKADVSFTGRVPHEEMPRLYREHDILVFPSVWEEPFGLTHLEAMASGAVVVSTADGGQAEFLIDGQNALVFQKEDAHGLADKIVALVEEPGLSGRLASQARTLVERDFSIDRYVTDLEAFLVDAHAAQVRDTE